MAKTCIKCGYARRETDTAPDYECPACGVVYAKAEAAAAQAAVARARTAAMAEAMAQAAARARPQPAAESTDDAKARADALVRQFAVANAGRERKANPMRGMALVALVAFSVGFASAAGLYSAAAKVAKKAPADRCVKDAAPAPSAGGLG